jgi:hypothetical protein
MDVARTSTAGEQFGRQPFGRGHGTSTVRTWVSGEGGVVVEKR